VAGSRQTRPPAGGPPLPEESTVHLSVPAVLLTVVYAAALAVAVSAPGQHLVAGLVVLTGLVTRWAVRHRRAHAVLAVAPADAVLTPDAAPARAAA
jgi:hypothetical protein